jgi:ornithine cyclodeaminase/alanine dehydrogenase-like protein (mu-crystallin family)
MSRAVRLSDLPVIDDRGLRALLPITSAVVALEAALRDGTAPGGAPARTSILTEAGELLLMPAATPRYVGVKLVSVAPGNVDLGLPRVQGVYVLFDTLSLTPRALVDGIALTSWRTPAVSAVAVRHLAPRRPVRLVVIGTGPQAHGHVEAVAAIRPVSHVTCVGRDRGRAEQLAVWVAHRGLPAAVVAGSDLPDDLELPLRQADVVVCATTARRPVFNSRWLGDEALVIAVGSHEPDAREVDSALVSRATVVVETREAALREAGDLIVPIRNLEVGPDVIAGDLAELVTERVAIQPDRPRLFKSVGEAWEDLVIAAAAYDQLIDTAEGLREPHS